MPYIHHSRRLEVHELPTNSGELNYAITKLFDNYIQLHGLSYNSINDCLGAAEGAKLELYRRVAAPYEDHKVIENGDVYHVPRTTPRTEDDGR